MNNKIHALIVDDEEPGRANLRYALQDHADWTVVAECASVAAARAAMGQSVIDVIFLDIQMPRETGLTMARDLSTLAEPPLVIFVTAYNAHAIEAFELHALDYLLKPFDDQRLAAALERAAAMLKQRQQAAYALALRQYAKADSDDTPAYWQQVSVRSVGRLECIQLDDVLWIEAAGNYMQLHLASRTVMHRVSLSQLEKHLDPTRFIRVHRSAIVRQDQLQQLEVIGDGVYQLLINQKDKVAVSERYVAEIRRRMRDG
ncbi:LytTR family DNA-binding domain-containing protein [Undibacterium sp. TS12]|uniref:LytR/AlgR family response regulator transcription factor n=1 Tax=Undibacterium sp. TS12 TaxID=2908202 RepID=UPI001F4C8FD7|nr:LytTR family DNA-binding domain-containing protein [Undibacterium sp. TS12]MCH8618238.1 LytTR family DNA-binding domain-containing protein [Undibacterium sp. TS12]